MLKKNGWFRSLKKTTRRYRCCFRSTRMKRYMNMVVCQYYFGGWWETIHSFIPLECAECDDSLPFSGASSFHLCYIPSPSTLFHQLVFYPPSPHLALYFLVYLSALLFPNSYIILVWKFYFLPFSVHAQTNVTYLTLLSLL